MKYLSKQEEIRLFKEIERNSLHAEVARNKILYANRGLVEGIANKFYTTTLDKDDLIQVGMVAANKAIDCYDFKRNARFSTFAYKFIIYEIRREIQKFDKTISLPVHKQENISIINRIDQELGGNVSSSLISKFCKLKSTEIDDLRNMEYTITGIDEGMEVADCIEEVDDLLCRKELWKFSEGFSQEERHVMKLRYMEEKSFNEIGEIIGVSREKVRQINNNVLCKYKEYIKEK